MSFYHYLKIVEQTLVHLWVLLALLGHKQLACPAWAQRANGGDWVRHSLLRQRWKATMLTRKGGPLGAF